MLYDNKRFVLRFALYFGSTSFVRSPLNSF